MAKQTIGLGTPPAGTDGDTVRTGFDKANKNFDELYTRTQGRLVKSTAGGAGTVALSAAEALNGTIALTGTITGNKVVTVPATPTMAWLVTNSTTGNFSVTFRSASGVGVVVPQGVTMQLFSDGTNVVKQDIVLGGGTVRTNVGGDTTDITLGDVVYASALFTAAGIGGQQAGIVMAQADCGGMTPTPFEVIASLRLIHVPSSAQVAVSLPQAVSLGSWCNELYSGGRFALHLPFSGLTSGAQYRAEFIGRKSAAIGPVYFRNLQLSAYWS